MRSTAGGRGAADAIASDVEPKDNFKAADEAAGPQRTVVVFDVSCGDLDEAEAAFFPSVPPDMLEEQLIVEGFCRCLRPQVAGAVTVAST